MADLDSLNGETLAIFEFSLRNSADAWDWANIELEKRGDDPLYCQPRSMVIVGEQLMQILKSQIATTDAPHQYPLSAAGLFLLDGMRETFPCD